MVNLGLEAKAAPSATMFDWKGNWSFADSVPSFKPLWTMQLPAGKMFSERRGRKLPTAKLKNGFI